MKSLATNLGPANRRAGAFTLVELLTVIAIIGILAALLLPVLAEGKARAKRLWCESNLEQVGLAFHIFANDHHGRFPMDVPMNDGGACNSAKIVENPFWIPMSDLAMFRRNVRDGQNGNYDGHRETDAFAEVSLTYPLPKNALANLMRSWPPIISGTTARRHRR
jgi:prepilin-type N-terminal cleavage/methylation domain-containing protein